MVRCDDLAMWVEHLSRAYRRSARDGDPPVVWLSLYRALHNAVREMSRQAC